MIQTQIHMYLLLHPEFDIRAEGTYQCRYQIQGVIISLLPFLSPTVVLSLTKNLYKKDRRNMFAIIVLVLVTTDMYL